MDQNSAADGNQNTMTLYCDEAFVDAIEDLFAVDALVDRNAYDLVAETMDALYDVDREMDGVVDGDATKAKQVEDVMVDLLRMDMMMVGNSTIVGKDGFSDPFRSTTASRSFRSGAPNETTERLFVSASVGGEVLLDLIAVDAFVDGRRIADAACSDMDAVRDLWETDQAVDEAWSRRDPVRSALQDMLRTDHLFGDKATGGGVGRSLSSSSDPYQCLLAIDQWADGRQATRDGEKDDDDGPTQRRRRCEAILADLLRVDRTVDAHAAKMNNNTNNGGGGPNKEKRTEAKTRKRRTMFARGKSAFSRRVMRTLFRKRMPKTSPAPAPAPVAVSTETDRFYPLVFDAARAAPTVDRLSMSRAGGGRRADDVDHVRPLLEVDRLMSDLNFPESDERLCDAIMAELRSVDALVDAGVKRVPAVKKNKRRNIFSQKEKEMSRSWSGSFERTFSS